MRFVLLLVLSMAPLAWADPVVTSDEKPAVEARPAAVSLYGGIEIAKCLIEKYEKGAWIIWEGQRYWYLNDYIRKIVYLEGAPDAQLLEWLKQANEARELAEKRAAEADALRRKAAETAAATASSNGNGTSTDAKDENAGSSKSGTGSADKKGGSSRKGDSGSSGNSGSSNNDRNRDKYGPERDNPIGGGGHNRPGLHRADDWRVLKVDRKLNEMLLRNRLFKQEVRVEVKNPADLDKIRSGDILYGNLGAGDSTLMTESGVAVELTTESVVNSGNGLTN